MGRGKSRRSLELIEACHEILAVIQPATVADRQLEAFARIAGVTREEAARAFREAFASGTIIIDRST
jgi:hypothetical protein